MSEEEVVQDSPEVEIADGAHDAGAEGHSHPMGWFEEPANVNKIIWALCIACAASVLADLFYEQHGTYGFQDVIGFDAGYGFVSCVLLVLAAKQLRKLVMRDEDYYD